MKKRESIGFEDAYKKALALVDTRPCGEWVSLFDARGRTLFKDIVCSKNLPSYNNAAMDGFAFKYDEKEKPLKIAKRILAGESISACLGKYECYKIMTGAKVPEDADTIATFEECHVLDDTHIQVPSTIKKGNAFRYKGEEQMQGSILLKQGEVLTSTKIALLASQGMAYVEVYQALKIAIISTGNELKKPWEKASEDEIYDVNAFALKSLLQEQGFDASYAGVVADNLKEAKDFFAGLKSYDVVVSSGGISMGEADFVEQALIENGFVASFHGINIKPGKPTMMGKMGKTIVASMPGNPLAAYVNAFLFFVPLLRHLQGQTNMTYTYQSARNASLLTIKSGRVNLILGKLENGIFEAYDNNRYGSGMITPLVHSNAVLICDEQTSCIQAGALVNVLMFQPLFSTQCILTAN